MTPCSKTEADFPVGIFADFEHQPQDNSASQKILTFIMAHLDLLPFCSFFGPILALAFGSLSRITLSFSKLFPIPPITLVYLQRPRLRLHSSEVADSYSKKYIDVDVIAQD